MRDGGFTWSSEYDVEVETIDSDGGIVLDAQVNVLLNTEAKVSGGGEIVASQLVFTHLQATLEDLLSFGSSHCAVHGNFFIPTNTEAPHGVAGF